jgi:rsbT co-antagonist protein RsbR
LSGRKRYLTGRIYPIRGENGEVKGAVVLTEDVSERHSVAVEREALQQQIIAAQGQALKELSTPIIPIMEQILVMPLVGHIDSRRARDLTRALLQGINQYRAREVILDITGVPLVDSEVAFHLNKTIQAARLKGVHTILTGISDAVAEAIVDLGIDWSDLETLRDLQSGLVLALSNLGLQLISKVGDGDNGKSLRGFK